MCYAEVLAGGLQLGGAVYSADQQRKAAKATSDYDNYLADQSEKEADLTQFQASKDVASFNRSAKAFRSNQNVVSAVNGTSGSATAEDIALDTLDKQKMDEMAIRYNANLKYWDQENQAKSYRYAAQNAISAGNVAATNTLLGSATQFANSYRGGKS